jgi:pantoate kinase
MEKLNEKRLEKIGELIRNPRPGSKVAAAKEFGIDLTLTFEQLKKTPQQRVDDQQGAMRSLEEFRRQAEKRRKQNGGRI